LLHLLSPSQELLSQLGISRATFYRLKKSNKLAEFIEGKREGHAQYINEWVQWREMGLYVRPWSKTYKRVQLIQIKLYFNKYKLVSSSCLEEWLSEIAPEKHSNRKDRHAAVSSLAKYLSLKEILSQEEYIKIKGLYPRKPPGYQPDQRIIYEEDLKALILKAAKGHSKYQSLLNQTLLIFLSETGLRVSEACSLTKEDICFSDDPRQSFIKVRKGKGGKSRVIPFSKTAQECLNRYLSTLPEELHCEKGLLWAFNPKHGYTPLTSDCIGRRFQLLSQQTDIHFSAHSLRHHRITQWANNPRIPITVVQKWAGHSSLEVTQKYIHIRDEEALLAAF
jgi:integrase